MGDTRPCIVVQNDVGNKNSPLTEVIPLTSRVGKASYMPTHVLITPDQQNGLQCLSVAVAEQPRLVAQTSAIRKMGVLSEKDLQRVGDARRVQSPLP